MTEHSVRIFLKMRQNTTPFSFSLFFHLEDPSLFENLMWLVFHLHAIPRTIPFGYNITKRAHGPIFASIRNY